MDSVKPFVRGNRAASFAIAASIALVALWSNSAFSRTQTDWHESRRDPQSLDEPAQTLTIRVVDHVMLEPDPAALDATGLEPGERESKAGLQLHIAPRIASRLRGIFDAPDSDARDETIAADVPASPVAESEEIRETEAVQDDVSADPAIEGGLDAPLLERRMYRIDI